MDTTKQSNGTYTSHAVGTRVFENPWPTTTTCQQVNTRHQSAPATPRKSVFQSYTDNREHMASTSLQTKQPTGIGTTQFAGTQRLNSSLFPPGPQKSYYRKNLLSGIQDTNVKFHSTKPVPEPRTDPSSESPGLAATNTTDPSEQRRVEEDKKASVGSGGLENANNRGDSDSDGDGDGGVTLASTLAVFMQGPGNIKLPVRPIIPKLDSINLQQESQGQGPGQQRPQQQKSEQRVSQSEERENRKIEAVEKPPLKPRSSMASQMAALLQIPGVLNFVSHRPSIPVLPRDFPTPIYRTSLVEQNSEVGEGREEKEEDERAEKKRVKEKEKERKQGKKLEGDNKENDEREKKVEACECKAEAEPNYARTQSIFDKPHSTPKSSDSQVDKHEDSDTTQYWRTPSTPFVYLCSASTPPTTAQNEPNLPSPGRRAFGHFRDGDIVGDEASELPKANKGRLIMEKMGYKEGTPLGNGDGGLIEPVRVEVRLRNRGLGLAKQEPGLPTHTSTNQASSSQIAPIQIIPASIYGMNNFQQTSSGNIRQLQQMNVAASQQIVRYSLATPLDAYQTRLRMVQILSHLDVLGLLDTVDYNYILVVGMDRVAEDQQQSWLGFLVEAELVQIVTREYKRAVLRRGQRGNENGALSYEKVNKGGYW